MESRRITSVEALRVTSMFLIVVMHYIFCGLKLSPIHQYYDLSCFQGCLDYLTMEPLYILSGTAVNCYVMITGYFLIDKLTYRWGGVIKTWFLAFFYSVLFLIIAFLLNFEVVKADIIQAVFPVYQSAYWFVTSYIGLLLFAPILSRAAVSFSKRSYLIVLAVLFVVTFQFLYGEIYGGFKSIIFFGYLFLIAGYIRLHGIPKWVLNHKYLYFFILWLIILIFATGINLIRGGWGSFQLISSSYDGPLLFLSLIIFIIFVTANNDCRAFGWLSKLAPYTFGIYLIHTNDFVNDRIWNVIPRTFNYPIFFHCVFFCIILFLICVLIDYIRERLFKALKIDNLLKIIGDKIPQI